MRRLRYSAIALLLLLAACKQYTPPAPVASVSSDAGQQSAAPAAVEGSSSAEASSEAVTNAVPVVTGTAIAARTKETGCAANGALPDPACTPGAILPEHTEAVICAPSFRTGPTRKLLSKAVWQSAFDEYGVTAHTARTYEVDHLISLELGGSNDIANLWPELADPRPGYHEKDLVENYLHAQVCNGALTLPEAQGIIAHDWLSYYNANQGKLHTSKASRSRTHAASSAADVMQGS